MKNLFVVVCVFFFVLAGFQYATAQNVPGTTNIQINLAESGLPVNGNKTVSITYGVYSTGNQTVTFNDGLGTISVNLPIETLKTAPTSQLQVSVDGVNVTNITPETVPYSKVTLFAYEADNASKIGGSAVNFTVAPQEGQVLIFKSGKWTTGTIQAGQVYTADGTTIMLTNNQFSMNTTNIDGRYVNEGQVNSITSSMITDGTLQASDFANGVITSGTILIKSGQLVEGIGSTSYTITTNLGRLPKKVQISIDGGNWSKADWYDDDQDGYGTLSMLYGNDIGKVTTRNMSNTNEIGRLQTGASSGQDYRISVSANQITITKSTTYGTPNLSGLIVITWYVE